MAKHRGRGFATIEYPTGMNQNGDPSQAWIKLKPDGRVDVFAGTVDIGQGSKTVHTQIVADALGVPYDWVTMDNSNTDSSPVCTGTFASRGTFIGGNAVRYAAEKATRAGSSTSPPRSSRSRRRPRDRRRRGPGQGRAGPQDLRRRTSAGAATCTSTASSSPATGAALKPLAEVDDDDGSVDRRAALGDLLRGLRHRRRGRRRDRRDDGAQDARRSTTSAARSTRRSSRGRSRAAR